MQARKQRCYAIVICAFLAVAMISAPTPSEAQEGGVPPPIAEHHDAAGVFSGLGLIGGLVFLSADVVYATQGRWLPPGWAWSQLGMAAFNVGAGVWQLTAELGTPGLGIANLAVASAFIAHSVLSLLYYMPPKKKEAPTKNVALSFFPSVASVRGGGMAQVLGTF